MDPGGHATKRQASHCITATGQGVRVLGQGSGEPGEGWQQDAEGMCKGVAQLRQHACMHGMHVPWAKDPS